MFKAYQDISHDIVKGEVYYVLAKTKLWQAYLSNSANDKYSQKNNQAYKKELKEKIYKAKKSYHVQYIIQSMYTDRKKWTNSLQSSISHVPSMKTQTMMTPLMNPHQIKNDIRRWKWIRPRNSLNPNCHHRYNMILPYWRIFLYKMRNTVHI